MNNFIRRFAYKLVIKTITRKAKKIITVSNHTKYDLQKIFNVSEDHIKVIYNGVTPEFSEKSGTSRPDLMKKLGLQKPYFLYTGVWRNHKNVTGLIKAFAELNKDLGYQYDLVITGRHNPSYKEIPNLITKMKLEDNIHLVGMVSEDDLRALYQYALSYVFPSFYEGFGLPPLEAMQCGTPVVVSDKSAIPEVCGEKNALFFNPYDIKDIKEKMRIIATDASVRQRLVNNGFERVKFFDWGKMTNEVLGVYYQYK